MPREDLIIFLDLETTGVDENDDEIIEVGAVLLDAQTLEERGSFSSIIAPSDKAYARWMGKDVVRDMHRVNGLQDVIDAELRHFHSNLLTRERVDQMLIDWLKKYIGSDNTQIPYGGSGVAHFDRRFIKRYLPRFDRMLTHWAYDVGTVRRMMIKAGVTPAEIILEASGQVKNHRALQDARVHADEFRYYVNLFGTMRGMVVNANPSSIFVPDSEVLNA